MGSEVPRLLFPCLWTLWSIPLSSPSRWDLTKCWIPSPWCGSDSALWQCWGTALSHQAGFKRKWLSATGPLECGRAIHSCHLFPIFLLHRSCCQWVCSPLRSPSREPADWRIWKLACLPQCAIFELLWTNLPRPDHMWEGSRSLCPSGITYPKWRSPCPSFSPGLPSMYPLMCYQESPRKPTILMKLLVYPVFLTLLCLALSPTLHVICSWRVFLFVCFSLVCYWGSEHNSST